MSPKKKLTLYCILTICTCLILTLSMPIIARADGPEDDLPHESSRRTGLLSTEVQCLAVEGGTLNEVSATLILEWEGQIDQAFLVVTASGSEGGHSLYVNGQRVGNAPARPDGLSCQTDPETLAFAPTDMISIPAEILVEGENVVTLTNDANVEDGWTAINLYLEIHGVLSGPPVALLENPSLAMASLSPATSQDIGAMAVISGSELLDSSYETDPNIKQRVWYQVPETYTGTPGIPTSGSLTPLLIGTHGWGGTGENVLTLLGAETNTRGWLLAAPDMHGRYYTSHGKYAFAWPGAQHDIIDTIVYMRANYNVDTSKIYIAGGSMGGQTAAVMAGKYPDIFAAAGPWKPITDLSDMLDWPVGSYGWIISTIQHETDLGCDVGTDIYDYSDDSPLGCGKPTFSPGVLFEYQRRSAVEMPQNSRLIPITLWHDEVDQLVVINHSDKLKAALDMWSPTTPVVLHRVNTGSNCTDGYYHCYTPPPLPNHFSIPASNLFEFLDSHTLSSQPPLSLTIRTDESKPYYWLNIAQTGGDHWSEIETSYDWANRTVTAVISDAQPLTLGFNFDVATTGTAGISQPGLNFPATTYVVTEEGGSFYTYQKVYSSGYFTVTLNNTGQISLTIASISGGADLSKVYLPIIVQNN